MLTESLLRITEASKSGKFEAVTTVIIEGDSYTRSTVYTAICGTFDTVEAALAYAKKSNDNDETELGVGVRGPANFVARMRKVNASREAAKEKAYAEYLYSLPANEIPF
jgi:hypothetical protein